MGKHDTEERYEVDAQQEEQQPGAVAAAAAALVAAFSAAFHNGMGNVLDGRLLRTIGNSYASMCFAYGPAQHPPSIEALRKAMEAYVAVNPAAEPLLFPDVDELLGTATPSKPAVSPYRQLMETIRAAYWKKRQVLHDAAALDAIADDGRGYDPSRFALKNVVDALVRVSPRAQYLNARYFGGRFR